MHLEWGGAGLREGGRLADVVVVVDVLSFSTAVAEGVAAGAEVYPLRAGDRYATKVAERLGARLVSAGDRVRTPERVVLVSPHGGALALDAAATGATVVAGCLRNASAVGAWMAERAGQGRMVVVAAGDEWRDGSPRWAVEDLLAAGAIFSALPGHALSAEAQVAAAAFAGARDRLGEILRTCTSGRLVDTRWAAELDASPVVPVLVEGRFQAAPDGREPAGGG